MRQYLGTHSTIALRMYFANIVSTPYNSYEIVVYFRFNVIVLAFDKIYHWFQSANSNVHLNHDTVIHTVNVWDKRSHGSAFLLEETKSAVWMEHILIVNRKPFLIHQIIEHNFSVDLVLPFHTRVLGHILHTLFYLILSNIGTKVNELTLSSQSYQFFAVKFGSKISMNRLIAQQKASTCIFSHGKAC